MTSRRSAAILAAIKPAQHPSTQTMDKPAIHRWIKTECGRARYAELADRAGVVARLRLGWFVLIAALRDWRLRDPDLQPDQAGGSDA